MNSIFQDSALILHFFFHENSDHRQKPEEAFESCSLAGVHVYLFTVMILRVAPKTVDMLNVDLRRCM